MSFKKLNSLSAEEGRKLCMFPILKFFSSPPPIPSEGLKFSIMIRFKRNYSHTSNMKNLAGSSIG